MISYIHEGRSTDITCVYMTKISILNTTTSIHMTTYKSLTHHFLHYYTHPHNILLHTHHQAYHTRHAKMLTIAKSAYATSYFSFTQMLNAIQPYSTIKHTHFFSNNCMFPRFPLKTNTFCTTVLYVQ